MCSSCATTWMGKEGGNHSGGCGKDNREMSGTYPTEVDSKNGSDITSLFAHSFNPASAANTPRSPCTVNSSPPTFNPLATTSKEDCNTSAAPSMDETGSSCRPSTLSASGRSGGDAYTAAKSMFD